MKHWGNSKLAIAGVCVLGGLLVWLAFFWQPAGRSGASELGGNTAATVNMPSSPRLPSGGDFTLTGPDGKVSLHDYRGQVVLIYFGYTFCPDVCPTSLAIVGEALAALAPEERERVRGLFVSVDPERDTADVLKAYAPHFHPAITGVSGTSAELADVARRYGVIYAKQKSIDGRPYTVDHSSATYLVGPDGALRATLPHGLPAAQMVAAVRQALAPDGVKADGKGSSS